MLSTEWNFNLQLITDVIEYQFWLSFRSHLLADTELRRGAEGKDDSMYCIKISGLLTLATACVIQNA